MAGSIMTPAEMQADVAARIADLDSSAAAKFRLAVEFSIKVANIVLEAPPALRGGLYRAAMVEGTALGLDMRTFPGDYGPATETHLLGMWKAAGHAELVTRGGATSH